MRQRILFLFLVASCIGWLFRAQASLPVLQEPLEISFTLELSTEPRVWELVGIVPYGENYDGTPLYLQIYLEVAASREQSFFLQEHTGLETYTRAMCIAVSYFGYRHYDPRTKQWLSRDPIGEAGGLNLFAYTDNDPINLGPDYLGLQNGRKNPAVVFRGDVRRLGILSEEIIQNQYLWSPEYAAQRIAEYEELYQKASSYKRSILNEAFSALPSFPSNVWGHSREHRMSVLQESYRHRAVAIENEIRVTKNTTRLVGGLQLIGGTSETTAAAMAVPASSGLATPALYGVMVHGSDTATAGLIKLVHGADQQTMTSLGLQAAGLRREHAEWVDAGIGIAGSVYTAGYTRSLQAGVSQHGLRRSTVITPERAHDLLMKYGRSADQATDYINSFDGPITARIVEPGESFLRYTDVANSRGSFLTNTRFSNPGAAVDGLYLRPYGNSASLLQPVSASGRSIILEGGILNGGRGVSQSLILDRNAFIFGTGFSF